MKEVFIVIKDYSGYEVSNLGIVRNVKTKSIIKPTLNRPGGYLKIDVRPSANTRKAKLIHRLVAENHIPNPFGYKEVDHIDRNKENNRVDNLRWVTREQNMYNVHAKTLLYVCEVTGKFVVKSKGINNRYDNIDEAIIEFKLLF